jgi:hypothetical protein
VKAATSLLAVGALAVAGGCGSGSSGGLPASGTGVSCPAGTYILDGGCVALPPFSDASVVSDQGDSDGSAAAEDAAPLAPDAGFVDAVSDAPGDAPPEASDAAVGAD